MVSVGLDGQSVQVLCTAVSAAGLAEVAWPT